VCEWRDYTTDNSCSILLLSAWITKVDDAISVPAFGYRTLTDSFLFGCAWFQPAHPDYSSNIDVWYPFCCCLEVACSEVGGTFRAGPALSPAGTQRVQHPKQPLHPVGLPFRPVKHHGEQPPKLDSSPTRRAGSSHLFVRISRAPLVKASQHHSRLTSSNGGVKTTPRQTAPVHWSLNLSSLFSRAHGDVLAKNRAILPAELSACSSTPLKLNLRQVRQAQSAARHIADEVLSGCLCFCSCDLCRKMWEVYIVWRVSLLNLWLPLDL
jgi:hypothetical protein